MTDPADLLSRHDHCSVCGADLGVNEYPDEESMDEPVYCSEKCKAAVEGSFGRSAQDTPEAQAEQERLNAEARARVDRLSRGENEGDTR